LVITDPVIGLHIAWRDPEWCEAVAYFIMQLEIIKWEEQRPPGGREILPYKAGMRSLVMSYMACILVMNY